MEATLIVNTQVFENYNFGQFGANSCGDYKPQWKPKGYFQFKVELDSTDLLYMDGFDIQHVLTQMLAEESSDLERFEYIDYEIHHSKPYQLSTKDFMNKMESLHNQKV